MKWSSQSPLDACILLCNCRNTGALIAQNMEALRAESLRASSSCLDSRAASSASASFDAATLQVRTHVSLVLAMPGCHAAVILTLSRCLPHEVQSAACAGTAMGLSGSCCRRSTLLAGVLTAQNSDADTNVAVQRCRVLDAADAAAKPAQPSQRAARRAAQLFIRAADIDRWQLARQQALVGGVRCVIIVVLYHHCTNTSFVAAPACRLRPVVGHFVYHVVRDAGRA